MIALLHSRHSTSGHHRPSGAAPKPNSIALRRDEGESGWKGGGDFIPPLGGYTPYLPTKIQAKRERVDGRRWRGDKREWRVI